MSVEPRTSRRRGFCHGALLAIASTLLAFGCGSRGVSTHGTSEATSSHTEALEAGEGILNGSFEIEPYGAGAWPAKPIPPGWQLPAGTAWWMHRPVAGGQWPAATHQNQYIWLGSDLTVALTTLQQRVGTVRANARYTALVDFHSNHQLSQARISLKAFDGSAWTTLATTPWPEPPPPGEPPQGMVGWKRDLRVQFDSTSLPSAVGRALYVVIENERSSTIVDNVRFDSRPLGVANVLVNPSFETPWRIEGLWERLTPTGMPPWRFSGDAAFQMWPKLFPPSPYEPQASDGYQWMWIGQNDWFYERTLSQSVGALVNDTLYTFAADVCPRHEDSQGSLRLVAKPWDGPGCARILAESKNWSELPAGLTSAPCFTKLEVSFEDNLRLGVLGDDLSVQIRSTRYSAIVDNASLSVDSVRLTAFDPQPADGTANLPASVVLRWQKGENAAPTAGSEVFFSANWSDVAARKASAKKATVGDVTCSSHIQPRCGQHPLGSLANGTYYWAIDTVHLTQAPKRWPGPIWRFTVGPDPNAAAAPARERWDCGGKLDVLFVLDDSGDMTYVRNELVARADVFLNALSSPGTMNGPGAHDLHVGVLTSSAFTIPNIAFCDSPNDGILHSQSNGAQLPTLSCPLTLARFDTIRPSVTSQSLTDFRCRLAVPTTGCGFEQPLEASLAALWPSADPRVQLLSPTVGQGDQANFSFLRPDAMLAVIFLSTEDDCSTPNTNIFTPPAFLSPTDPLYSQPLNLRCFFNSGALYPTSRYRDALAMLKPDAEYFVGAIVGVPGDLTDDPIDYENPSQRAAHYATILGDSRMQEVVDPNTPNPNQTLVSSCSIMLSNPPSCDPPGFCAKPPRRYVGMVRDLGHRGMVESLCGGDLTIPLTRMATRIRTLLYP